MHLMTTCSDYPDVPTNPARLKRLGQRPYRAAHSLRDPDRATVFFLGTSLESTGFRLGFALISRAVATRIVIFKFGLISRTENVWKAKHVGDSRRHPR